MFLTNEQRLEAKCIVCDHRAFLHSSQYPKGSGCTVLGCHCLVTAEVILDCLARKLIEKAEDKPLW